MIALLVAAAGVTHASYGTTRAGVPVERYVLTNARGASLAVLTLGGTVDEIRVPDRNGRLGNVVLRLPDVAAHEARAYRATTEPPTVINLTNHSYFNLGGTGTIFGQTLSVAGKRYAVADARKLPTGELRPVAGTPFDLTQPVALGERVGAAGVAPGFDTSWLLDKPPGRFGPAGRLVDPASRRTLTVETSEPALLVYTANGFDGTLKGADGPIVRHAGVALETQHLPDSPNRPGLPSTALRLGETFRSTTIYCFGVARVRR